MIPALSALALFVPATVSTGTGEDSTAWLELDRELAGLTGSLARDHTEGIHMKADIIISAQMSDDDVYSGTPGDNLSGFDLRRARLTNTGSVGETHWKISGELSSGSLSLRDAYVYWNVGESTRITFGRYKEPLLWSGRTSSFLDPFHDVAVTGAENDGRSSGVMAEGSLADFSWLLSLQNGVDSVGDDYLIAGRLQWDIVGGNAFGKYHGAYGYGEDTLLSVAVGFSDDGAIDNGSLSTVELGLVMDALSFRGDLVEYDENYDVGTTLDPDGLFGGSKANTTASSMTLGYLLPGDEWEALARWEDLDDADDTSRSSVGLLWYSSVGPKGRWALLYQELSSDIDANEGTRVELSFSLASS